MTTNKFMQVLKKIANWYIDLLRMKVSLNGIYAKYATYFWRLLMLLPLIIAAIYLIVKFCQGWQIMVDFVNYVIWGK